MSLEIVAITEDVLAPVRSPRAARRTETGRTWFRDPARRASCRPDVRRVPSRNARSEEHTSELQSRGHLVCRLLLEKKKKKKENIKSTYNQEGWKKKIDR